MIGGRTARCPLIGRLCGHVAQGFTPPPPPPDPPTPRKEIGQTLEEGDLGRQKLLVMSGRRPYSLLKEKVEVEEASAGSS